MNSSRLNTSPERLFECFCEVVCEDPHDAAAVAWPLMKYPDEYEDADTLKAISKFCYPCVLADVSSGSLQSAAVEQFTFTWTDATPRFRFGFCRRSTDGRQCMCIVSFLPWHEFFYGLLNYLAELLARKSGDADFLGFLKTAYEYPIINILNGTVEFVDITYKPRVAEFKSNPNVIPSPHAALMRLPQSRILTEYVAAIEPDVMIQIFASLIQERRIVMHSMRLTKLTACVHACCALLYPMQWQHIFVPLLPQHLVDYLSAPMPYLIGVPTQLLRSQKCANIDLSESVVVDIDAGTIKSMYAEDLKSMPHAVVSTLRHGLRNQADEDVHRAFMRALVHLIGGYRNGLKIKEGELITFDSEKFVQSRPPQWQNYIRGMQQLQIFRQFIEERLAILNGRCGLTDPFEKEVTNMLDAEGTSFGTGGAFSHQYSQWIARSTNKLKHNAAVQLRDVTGKVRDRGKKAYNNFEHILRDLSDQLTTTTAGANDTDDAGGSASPPTVPIKPKKLAGAGGGGVRGLNKSHRAHSLASAHQPRASGSEKIQKSGFENNFVHNNLNDDSSNKSSKRRSPKHSAITKPMQIYRRPPPSVIKQKSADAGVDVVDGPISSAVVPPPPRSKRTTARRGDERHSMNASLSSSSDSSRCSSGADFHASQAAADAKLNDEEEEDDGGADLLIERAHIVSSGGENLVFPPKHQQSVNPVHSIDALLFGDLSDNNPVQQQKTTVMPAANTVTTQPPIANNNSHRTVYRTGTDTAGTGVLPTPPHSTLSSSVGVHQSKKTPAVLLGAQPPPQQHVGSDTNINNKFSSTTHSSVQCRNIQQQQLSSNDSNSHSSEKNDAVVAGKIQQQEQQHPGVRRTKNFESVGAPSSVVKCMTASFDNKILSERNSNFQKTTTTSPRASSVQRFTTADKNDDDQNSDAFVPTTITTNLKSDNSQQQNFDVFDAVTSSSNNNNTIMPVQSNSSTSFAMLRPQPFLSPASTGGNGRHPSPSSSTTSESCGGGAGIGITSKTSRNAFDSVIGELVNKVGDKTSGALGGGGGNVYMQQKKLPLAAVSNSNEFLNQHQQMPPGSNMPTKIMRDGPSSPYFVGPYGMQQQQQQQQGFFYPNMPSTAAAVSSYNPATNPGADNNNSNFYNLNQMLSGGAPPGASAVNDDVYDVLSQFSSGGASNNSDAMFQNNNNRNGNNNFVENSLLCDAVDGHANAHEEELDILLGLKKPPPPKSVPFAEQQQPHPSFDVAAAASTNISRPSTQRSMPSLEQQPNNSSGGLTKIAPPASAAQQRLEAAAKKQQQQNARAPDVAAAGNNNNTRQTVVPVAAVRNTAPMTLPLATNINNTNAGGRTAASNAVFTNTVAANSGGGVPTHWERFDS